MIDERPRKTYRCKVCGFEWQVILYDINEEAFFAEFYGSADFDTRNVPVTCTACYVKDCDDKFKAMKERLGWT